VSITPLEPTLPTSTILKVLNKGDVLTYQVKVKNVGKADANFGPSQGGALPGIGVVLYYPNKLLEPLKTGVKPNVDLIKNELVLLKWSKCESFRFSLLYNRTYSCCIWFHTVYYGNRAANFGSW